MLNKNDPLIDSVKKVMEQNSRERAAAQSVNEKFGVVDRKALPYSQQGEWDAAFKQVLSEGLHPNQEKLDLNKNKKLDSQDFKMLRTKKKPMEESIDGDTTSPSSMGIKKPDYATGTPDYAKSKEQTVNRAAKTNLPNPQMGRSENIAHQGNSSVTKTSKNSSSVTPSTMKEEEQINEKAPPGAKFERMVKHIKDRLSKNGLSKKEKSIAYATAWKAKNNSKEDK